MHITLGEQDNKLSLNAIAPQTTQERLVGLSHTSSLSAHECMLFLNSKPDFYTFTMRETSIPLLILFFDSNQKLTEVHHAKPKQQPLITPSKPAQYILEAHPDLEKHLKLIPSETSLHF